MNARQRVFPPATNAAIDIMDVGATLEKLVMAASADSKTFAQLVEMSTLLTSQLKEAHSQNTTLLKIIKTLVISAPPTHSATEADGMAKNQGKRIKLCDPNGYFYSATMKSLQTTPAPPVTGRRKVTRKTLNSTTQRVAPHWGEALIIN